MNKFFDNFEWILTRFSCAFLTPHPQCINVDVLRSKLSPRTSLALQRDQLRDINVLASFDVVFLGCTQPFGDFEMSALATYVEQGGAIVVSSCAWGWMQLNRPHTILEHYGNALLRCLGANVAFCDAMSGATHADGQSFVVSATPIDALVNASQALAAGKA